MMDKDIVSKAFINKIKNKDNDKQMEKREEITFCNLMSSFVHSPVEIVMELAVALIFNNIVFFCYEMEVQISITQGKETSFAE